MSIKTSEPSKPARRMIRRLLVGFGTILTGLIPLVLLPNLHLVKYHGYFGFIAHVVGWAGVSLMLAGLFVLVGLNSRRWFAVYCALCSAGLAVLVVPEPVQGRSAFPVSGCINTLRYLNGAKLTWAMETHASDGDPVHWSDIIGPRSYIHFFPSCPAGGTYTLGVTGQLPRCSLGHEGHRLDPNP